MQLFYHPLINKSSKEVLFDKDESRHLLKVLRKKEGDTVHLTNGKGYIFEVTLLSSNLKKCIAQVTNTRFESNLPYRLHMAVSPTKLNDRYEWFLEKATEIGVSEITPIICDHSERHVIKQERYEKIIQSAVKQSLKAYLPRLNHPISFKEFIIDQNNPAQIKCIAHCENSERQSLKSIIQPKSDLLILIGPEGDFSNQEIQFAKEQGFIPVSLGSNRLRTETAAVIACHSVAYANED